MNGGYPAAIGIEFRTRDGGQVIPSRNHVGANENMLVVGNIIYKQGESSIQASLQENQ